MALHLITGYAGQEHITSADQGAYNIATFGDGNFVLNRGNKFSKTVVSNNSISIKDGEAMIQGRYIKMPLGTTETLTIENGTNGKNRNDLICIRYSKSAVNSTESASFVVIKGTESTGTASDPTYNTGKITDGDATTTDFPLYRVKLNGINIQTVETMFSIKTSMVEYMDGYQLPVATSSTLGGVKVGNGLSINSGALSVNQATSSALGGVIIGNDINVNNGTISVKKTSSVTEGSTDLITSGGVFSALANNSSVKVGNGYVSLEGYTISANSWTRIIFDASSYISDNVLLLIPYELSFNLSSGGIGIIPAFYAGNISVASVYNPNTFSVTPTRISFQYLYTE